MSDDYSNGIYAQVRPRPRVSVSVYVVVSLYDPHVHVRVLHCYLRRKLQHVRVLHCYLHRKLQLVFSTPDLVYLPRFHWFSVVV